MYNEVDLSDGLQLGHLLLKGELNGCAHFVLLSIPIGEHFHNFLYHHLVLAVYNHWRHASLLIYCVSLQIQH